MTEPAVPVAAVLVVRRDDPRAPGGAAALRELGGRSLLVRAVDSLRGAGPVSRVVVLAPPELVGLVTGGLGPGTGVDVVPSGTGIAGLSHVAWPEEPRIVLVHDPLQPLVDAALVRAVVEALVGDPEAAGVVPLGPMTDTVKWADAHGTVTGTADRDTLRTLHGPQGYRLAPLLAALTARGAAGGAATAGEEDLPGVVRAAGGGLRVVPAPAQVLRVASADDLVLAEAVLTPA